MSDPFKNSNQQTKKEEESDLVNEFKEILIKHSDTPEEFAEAGGYATVSATVGRFFNSRYEFKGRPNTWICLSSIPGRRRRSTVLEAVDFVINKVNETLFYTEAEKRFSIQLKEAEKVKKDKKMKTVEQILEKIVDDCIIEDGSAEGIADQIQGSKLDVYHISNEEFGCTLQEAYGKDSYKSGVKVLLSKLYDGNSVKVSLSQRGGKAGIRRIRKGLYVTLFCGMQEIHLYITEFAIRQGVQRRIFMVYVQVNHRYKDLIGKSRAEYWWDLTNYAMKVASFAQKCKELAEENKKFNSDISFIDVQWDVGVDTEINKVDEEVNRAVDVLKPTLRDMAKLSHGVHLAKFCMIREIAKMNIVNFDTEEKPLHTVIIKKDSFEKAMDFMNRVGKSADKSYDTIEEEASTKKYQTTDTSVARDRILNFIGEHMPEGVSQSQITLKFKNSMTADEITKLTTDLIQFGEITSDSLSTGGRKVTRWKIKEPKKEEET